MRIRPIVSLSVAATAVLLLAGCTSSAEPESSGTPTDSSACAATFASGETSDAVEVAGDFGSEVTVTTPEGFAPTTIERTALIEGDADDQLVVGDMARANYTVLDVATGEVQLDTLTTEPDGMDSAVDPQQIFGVGLECLPVGSRTVTVFPDGALGQGSTAFVLVTDAIEEIPHIATGTDVAPVEGMPTVELDEDGLPTITVPEGDAPTEVQIANLKQGDGDTVEPGDYVFVQYRGVKWVDNEEFDSTWARGKPQGFATTGVVAGFTQALEGQQVGSQVLAVIPPAFGYGNVEGHELQNETLVFVLDVIGVQHAG